MYLTVELFSKIHPNMRKKTSAHMENNHERQMAATTLAAKCDVATLAAKCRLTVQRCSGAAMRTEDLFAALGLIERHHVEVMRKSAGEAFSAAESVRAELSQADCKLVMLFRGNDSPSGRTLAGFMAHRTSEENSVTVNYLIELHLECRYRRRGLGTALVAEARMAAEVTGASGLMLTCDSRNSAARAFYAKHAFITWPCSPSAAARPQQRSTSGCGRHNGEQSECLVLLWGEGAMSRLNMRAELLDPSTMVAKSRVRSGSSPVVGEVEDADKQTSSSPRTPKRARTGGVQPLGLDGRSKEHPAALAASCALIEEVD